MEDVCIKDVSGLTTVQKRLLEQQGAKETAKATEDISGRIEAIQNDATDDP